MSEGTGYFRDSKSQIVEIPDATWISPGDFSAAYTSARTITLGGAVPTIVDDSELIFITVIPLAGPARTYVQGVAGVKLTHAAGVITIHNVVDPFTTGDKYRVGIGPKGSVVLHGDVNVDTTSVDTSGLIGKPAGSDGDFDTVWTSATEITCSNFPAWVPTFTADDIETIRQINNTGVVVNTYSRDDVAMSVAADVITVTGAAFVTTDTFVIYTNIDETNYHLNEIQAALEAGVAIPGVTHWSPNDFSATYTSSTTLTLAGLPMILSINPQIAFVLQVKVDNTSALWLQGINCTLTEAGGVVTVHGAGTPFVAADQYTVGIRDQEKGYDATQDANKVLVQNPLPDQWTDFEDYTTFAPNTVAYAEGGVISTGSKTDVNFAWSKTASDADNNYIKVIYLDASGSTVDYQEVSIGSPVGGVTQIVNNIYEVDKAAGVNTIQIPTKGFPFLRIDIAKATDTGTDSTWTTRINKRWA